MEKLLKVPFAFLFIAALIGLLLRWHFFQPIGGLVYPYWLHAHSHVMFLGWVFNALSAGFVASFIPTAHQSGYIKILLSLNILVLGMLIAFPLQGYGVYAIIVSTLHTVIVLIFIYRFFKDSRLVRSESVGFAKMALIFFLISAAGPFAVGALAANGLGHTPWYHLAVYFYLHFQYNGVFTFGALGLVFCWAEKKGIPFRESNVRIFRNTLFVSCFPAYVLSTLWTDPGMIFNIAGFVTALFQLAALVFLMRSVKDSSWPNIATTSRVLLIVSFLSFGLKLILQLLSAFPFFAMLAFEERNLVMAYLHLVLIGAISFALFAWYQENGHILLSFWTQTFIFIGFAGSEVALVSSDFLSQETKTITLVIASVFLVAGFGLMGLSSFTKRTLSKPDALKRDDPA